MQGLAKQSKKFMDNNNNQELPSKYQRGQEVEVNFYGAGYIKDCKVNRVHFTDGGFVSYDLTVKMSQDSTGKGEYAKLYNVPQLLIEDAGFWATTKE